MQIDTEHLHHWINAIRISNNPMRTMDAFWSGQIKSKEWLIENVSKFIHFPSEIEIYGGWVGVLASMFFISGRASYIKSIDIDPLCQHVAEEMNRIEFNNNKFVAITNDMCNVQPSKKAIIVNTSCEHITQEQYNDWLEKIDDNQLLVIQSNNYEIPEHVRIAKSLDEFKEQSKLTNIKYAGELELPLYTRYMIIGSK